MSKIGVPSMLGKKMNYLGSAEAIHSVPDSCGKIMDPTTQPETMSKALAKQKVKEFAGNLFTKLIDKVDEGDKDDERPPKPVPSTSPATTMGAAHSLMDSFHALHISPPKPKPDIDFVGGFHPGYLIPVNPTVPPPLRHASSDPPPKMPVPSLEPPAKQSLTMQMALRPDNAPARPSSAPSTPFSKSDLEELRPVLLTPTKPKPSSSKPSSKPTSKPSTPQRPPAKIQSASSSSTTSAPSTPSGKEGQVQCSGTTKAGKQCTRFVKVAPALDQMHDDDSDSDSNQPLERFCFQHTKELLGPSGCYARKNGEWVNFDDWIPAYLQTESQLSLRIEMERARSLSDVDGYIYTFEIREESGETIKLKVGRAVNLVKRIDEWGKQCGSKEQVLRGFYPNPEDDHNAQTTLMKGRVKAGAPTPCCHRLERLIHIELADLLATEIYLHPGWPALGDMTEPPSQATIGKRNGVKKLEHCLDCGSTHKEIFEFRRLTSGINKHKEWEKIVKPVIERWGRFVELYV